jgi:alpha-ketoglutarate-dependent taurine dioxygenase
MNTTVNGESNLHTVFTKEVGSLNAEQTLKELAQYGVLMLRSETLPTDLDAFEEFTKTVAKGFQIHGNPARTMISKDGHTQEVDAGTHPLPPHSEVTYLPFYPDTMWFYCQVAPRTGGETTVCDGIEILERLPPATRQFFAEHRIRYTHKYPKQAWSRPLPVPTAAHASKLLDQLLPAFSQRGEFHYRFDENEVMHASYVTSAITRTRAGEQTFANALEVSFVPRVQELRGGGVSMEDGSPVPQAILEDVAAASAQLQKTVHWKNGDILMIDNSRVMHGRRAIADAGHRRIFVRLGNRLA